MAVGLASVGQQISPLVDVYLYRAENTFRGGGWLSWGVGSGGTEASTCANTTGSLVKGGGGGGGQEASRLNRPTSMRCN